MGCDKTYSALEIYIYMYECTEIIKVSVFFHKRRFGTHKMLRSIAIQYMIIGAYFILLSIPYSPDIVAQEQEKTCKEKNKKTS